MLVHGNLIQLFNPRLLQKSASKWSDGPCIKRSGSFRRPNDSSPYYSHSFQTQSSQLYIDAGPYDAYDFYQQTLENMVLGAETVSTITAPIELMPRERSTACVQLLDVQLLDPAATRAASVRQLETNIAQGSCSP